MLNIFRVLEQEEEEEEKEEETVVMDTGEPDIAKESSVSTIPTERPVRQVSRKHLLDKYKYITNKLLNILR